ncbi:hypothetical protein TMES_10080 [Thalassospira mesophila]|uniref:Uncharacterized protein n=1 Tax=Thalassospira mesophila TaxID=1293891 RepID=A0A1Y2L1P0_9PROT|nr:hypothetical protein TMES_10080 [Thalassospira mesophila]
MITRTEFIKQDIPESAFDCAVRPALPQEPDTDTKTGIYIVGLLSAHDNCKGKLAAVRAIIKGTDHF